MANGLTESLRVEWEPKPIWTFLGQSVWKSIEKPEKGCGGTPNASGLGGLPFRVDPRRGRRFPFFRCLDYWRRIRQYASSSAALRKTFSLKLRALEAFHPFLRSIDMRTFAVRSSSDGEWENSVTSLIVSEKTVDEVKSIQEKLPKIRNNEVALFVIAVPFDYSPFDYFVQGKIRLAS